MPNWCSNRITIDGPAADLDAFMKAVTNSEGKISVLDSLVPRPEGIEDWYAWSLDNWGTKWADDMMLGNAPDDSEEIILIGDTAWAPPVDGYRQASALYPLLRFTMTYDEPGMCFLGAAVVQAGDLRGIAEIGFDRYPTCDWENDDEILAFQENVNDLTAMCAEMAETMASQWVKS